MRGFFLCCSLSAQTQEEEEQEEEVQTVERKSAQKEFKQSSLLRDRGVLEMQKDNNNNNIKGEMDHQQSFPNSGILSFNGGEDEELSRSALVNFKAKEEEIERRTMEVRERFQAQLGRVEEESKRLAMIREELEAFGDPMRKEVTQVRKRIDTIDKELKPLGANAQKKEREYKEALEAFNEKNKVKVQLINRLVELVSESEKLRMKKLEELSSSIDTMRPKDLKSTLSIDNN